MKGFYEFLLKQEIFCSFHKVEEHFQDKSSQKILRLFNVLSWFRFTKSGANLDYHHQKLRVSVASRVVERVLRIL